MIEYNIVCHSCTMKCCLQNPHRNEEDEIAGMLFKILNDMQVCMDCHADYFKLDQKKEW